jgi:iron(III) transport system ATP-binding protein
VLTVRGLRKLYPSAKRRGHPTVALAGVDLYVPTGRFVGVLGPSGSGKTTLLRCIAGFETPDAGWITLGTRTLVSPERSLRPFERGVGVVPQEGALFPHLSVAQNIGFGLTGERRQGRRERVAQLLELVGLTGLGDRRPDQLSGGQQQRVALARALAPEPELILLDEPFSALDAQLRAEVRTEVRELLRGLGSTVLLVTHDQAEALSMSDHLVVMREGRVSAAGDPREVYDRPADPELARFLGDALVLDGELRRVDGSIEVVCALGRLPAAHSDVAEGPCRVLLRPEQLTLSGPDAAGTAPPDGVPGTVCSLSYYGHDALVRIAVSGLAEPVAARVPGDRTVPVGERVTVSVRETVVPFPPSQPTLN